MNPKKQHQPNQQRSEVTARRSGPDGQQRAHRSPWRRPHLEVLGDLRSTTLGGSVIDIGDSQFPNTRP
ncbi:MAG: hypothetical protein SX243_05935 [Acidobacteriota bacterium]|nr:hypothetical protein [Acidobacteriota bacterium]